MAKVHGYARVSTMEQKDRLDKQEQAIKSWCLKNGHTEDVIYREHESDETHPYERQQFVQMIQNLRPGDIVAVSGIHRVCRSLTTILTLSERLRLNSISLVDVATEEVY